MLFKTVVPCSKQIYLRRALPSSSANLPVQLLYLKLFPPFSFHLIREVRKKSLIKRAFIGTYRNIDLSRFSTRRKIPRGAEKLKVIRLFRNAFGGIVVQKTIEIPLRAEYSA